MTMTKGRSVWLLGTSGGSCLNPYSAGIDFRRQILRLKSDSKTRNIGMQMKLKQLPKVFIKKTPLLSIVYQNIFPLCKG